MNGLFGRLVSRASRVDPARVLPDRSRNGADDPAEGTLPASAAPVHAEAPADARIAPRDRAVPAPVDEAGTISGGRRHDLHVPTSTDGRRAPGSPTLVLATPAAPLAPARREDPGDSPDTGPPAHGPAHQPPPAESVLSVASRPLAAASATTDRPRESVVAPASDAREPVAGPIRVVLADSEPSSRRRERPSADHAERGSAGDAGRPKATTVIQAAPPARGHRPAAPEPAGRALVEAIPAPEVHIRIGRVEVVTASPASTATAVPATRPAPPASPFESLADYLRGTEAAR